MALSLAIPMSMILDTLLDNDACSLAFPVANGRQEWRHDLVLYDSAGDTDGALPNPSNFLCVNNRTESDH